MAPVKRPYVQVVVRATSPRKSDRTGCRKSNRSIQLKRHHIYVVLVVVLVDVNPTPKMLVHQQIPQVDEDGVVESQANHQEEIGRSIMHSSTGNSRLEASRRRLSSSTSCARWTMLGPDALLLSTVATYQVEGS